MLKLDAFQSIAEMGFRFAALEQEKKELLALRERLQQPDLSPNNQNQKP